MAEYLMPVIPIYVYIIIDKGKKICIETLKETNSPSNFRSKESFMPPADPLLFTPRSYSINVEYIPLRQLDFSCQWS